MKIEAEREGKGGEFRSIIQKTSDTSAAKSAQKPGGKGAGKQKATQEVSTWRR